MLNVRIGHLVLRFLGLVLLAPVMLTLAPTTYAYHQATNVTWPNGSFLWLSNRRYHNSQSLDRPVCVVSGKCDVFGLWEQGAIANARAETASTLEVGDMTPGYTLVKDNCSGVPTDADDILLNYMDPASWNRAYPCDPNDPTKTCLCDPALPSPGNCGQPNGGITLHSPDPVMLSGWCGRMGTYSPCGDHVVQIDLNMYKICGQTDPCDLTKICGGPNPACVVPSDGRYDLVRLLMHEMGHASGLAEHCTDAFGSPDDSIMNNGASIPNSNPPQDCNGKKWTETGQWYSTDRVGLFNAYHPAYGESTESWNAARVISDGTDLGIYNLTDPAIDVSFAGRMFIGFRNDKVYNEQWEMAWSDDGVTWHRETHGGFVQTVNPVAGMLAHLGGLSIYAVFCCNGYPGYPSNTYQIYRQTWNGVWHAPVLEYSAGTSIVRCCEGDYPRVAHSRGNSQYAIAWTRTVSGAPLAEFSFIDEATGSFTGGVEAIDAFVVKALVFDDTGNPKVIYRVSGTGTSGIGGRRTRANGVWQPEEQFVIDGMTDPDAVFLVDGEGGYHWSASNSTHGDYHALQGGNLTFNYIKRLNGAYFQSAVDFGALQNPITGNYTLHGLAQRVFAKQAYSVGVVWTTTGTASDLWFIKRRVEGY